jgi:hypothetical protein
VNRWIQASLCLIALLALIGLVPAAAVAQPVSANAPVRAGRSSELWLVAGGAFAVQRGDCQTCEADTPHRQVGGVLANIGYRVTPQMDVGAELFWTSAPTTSGDIHTTHIDAVAQFRPWASKGMFIKGGAGMAFVRNWVDASGPDAINSKALSVVIGGGWAFRPSERVGLQVFGAQHAGAVGDLQTTSGDVPDVIGNFWSLGAALVIR